MPARIAALALGLGVLVAPQLPASAAHNPVAGAQTSGDSLFPHVGNGGYDVQHYDIDLGYDFNTKAIDATTTITAKAAKPLSSFSLDLEGLTVDSITVDGARARYARVIDAGATKYKLVITPATPVVGKFKTVIDYSGVPTSHTDPDGSSEGWVATADGASAVNEPVGAMTFFPQNNTPKDKATYDFALTVPTEISGSPSAAVSNGNLVSKVASDDGLTTTWNWNQPKQMATYLSLVSIGRYDVYATKVKLSSGRTIKEWSFVDSAISPDTKATINKRRAEIPVILRWLETKFGRYPGASTGVVVDVTSLGYALETQDRSFFERSISSGTLVHELVHQWFGDAVSPEDWADIWLNEGPATYITTQYEYDTATPTPTDNPETTYFNSYTEAADTSSLWTIPPATLLGDPANLFESTTYDRGAMTLAALHSSIGTSDYDKVMVRWIKAGNGGSASTADFIAIAEKVSGRDLTAFFKDWLYDADKPAWPATFHRGATS